MDGTTVQSKPHGKRKMENKVGSQFSTTIGELNLLFFSIGYKTVQNMPSTHAAICKSQLAIEAE